VIVMGKIRLCVVAAGAAALCAAVTACSSGGSARPPSKARLAPALPACTERVMLATTVGPLGACVDYRYVGSRLEVLAVAASYGPANSGYDLPYFIFAFRNPANGAIAYKFSSPVVRSTGVFSDRTRLIHLTRRAATRIGAGDMLQVSLWAVSIGAGGVKQMMASVTVTLYPAGLRCPDLGPGNGPDESTGQC
jgi:hypothetical protein